MKIIKTILVVSFTIVLVSCFGFPKRKKIHNSKKKQPLCRKKIQQLFILQVDVFGV